MQPHCTKGDYGQPASYASKRIVDGNVRPFYSSLFLDPEEAQHLQHLAARRREFKLALLMRQEETKRRIRNQSLIIKDWTKTAPKASKQSTDRWSKYRLSIERQSREIQDVEADEHGSSTIPAPTKPGSQVAQSWMSTQRRTASLVDARAPMQKGLATYRPPFLMTEPQTVTEDGSARSAGPCYTKLSEISARYSRKRLESPLNRYLTVDAEQILSSIQRHENQFSVRLVSLRKPDPSRNTNPQ
ncbi:Hypothetical protein GLP15_2099 [Giardia lamblia P15]|uniref:Uncharacterized protein n=1 Tax=Giardia intestinalis (strain P15) TaxID=658858 RepID=E1F6C8_GIAIA|nr:Hypothetical protein GLP15_2099 [Giardia lamblia P15]